MRLSLFGSLLALRSHRYSNRKLVTRRTIFISWIASHGRSVALAEQLGTEIPPLIRHLREALQFATGASRSGHANCF